MLAFLLSDKLDPFYQNISAFPTVFFTIAFGLCIVYWIVAAIGLVDIDIFHIDGLSIDMDSPGSVDQTGVFAGLLMRFGLVGVPVTLSISILTLIGWVLCYYAMYFAAGVVPQGWMRYVVGIPVFYGCLYGAAKITGVVIRPLRPLFANATAQTHKTLIGKIGVVRTSTVNNEFGELSVDDGGAGLILKVRSVGDDRFERGDRVVIFEKSQTDDTYRVMSENEYTGR